MKPSTEKLIFIVKTLVIIVMSVWIVIFLLLGLPLSNSISQEQIRQLVTWNQDDLEAIIEDLCSYDMPRVYVDKEIITTYMNLVRLPDGRYMLGDEGPDFSTSEELRHFMKKLKIRSIKFSLYDELQIVTFEVNDGWAKGFYWVDPDTPTEKAFTSHHDLTPSGDGWEFVDFDNRYYTEKICDNWYYFVVET